MQKSVDKLEASISDQEAKLAEDRNKVADAHEQLAALEQEFLGAEKEEKHCSSQLRLWREVQEHHAMQDGECEGPRY